MSQNPLVPSFRFPGILSDPNVPKGVSDALRLHSNAITDIYQAIPALKQQIDALQSVKSTSSSTSTSSSSTVVTTQFPGLGSVNDLIGDVSYTNQPSDNGALLLFGDASPVAVQLTTGVSSPYFLFVQNWGAGLVTFTPSSGTISYLGNLGASSMTLAEGYLAMLIFDGTNWWAATLPPLPVATDSSLGIVQPDGVTINIDSGIIYTQVLSDSGAPSFTPDTHGNPFYFDSGPSPWNGYIWDDSSWHQFGGSGGGGGGTVTSVGLTVPSWQSVSGSPITSAGTLAITDDNQSPNLVFAGPDSGASAPPTFRILAPSDLPIATDSSFGIVEPDGTTITIDSGIISAVGSGGGGTSFGLRASLPATVPASGSLYVCSDSPYSYISDGTNWHGIINGRVVGDPSLDSSYVTLHSGTFSSTTVSTAAGGIVLAGVAAGDQVLAYAKPVTPSSTLRISLAWLNSGQGGPLIWNANTGNIVFFRLTGGYSPGNLLATLHYSRYNVTSGEVANEGSAGNFSMLAPLTGYLGLWFDGTNWYTQLFLDGLLTIPVGTGVILSEALATWIGTNYTHVGFGVNNGTAGAHTMWGQHLSIVST